MPPKAEVASLLEDAEEVKTVQQEPDSDDRCSNSTVVLLDKIKKNRAKDMFETLVNQIKFFKEDKDEIKLKIDKNPECRQWYGNYYKHSHTKLNEMRTEWKVKSDTLSDDFLKQKMCIINQIVQSTPTDAQTIKWLSATPNVEQLCKNPGLIKTPQSCDKVIVEKIKHAIDENNWEKDKKVQELYEEYIETKIKNIVQCLEQEYEIGFQKTLDNLSPCNMYRSIVWAIPHEDDFIYSGKTLKKTVTIPYTIIHAKLAESNWVMRGYINNDQNYLLAHILFITSDSSHINLEGTKYTGGRIFLDFPIVCPLSLLAESKSFANATTFKQFIEEQSGQNGQYPHHSRGEHSENAFAYFLKDDRIVESIVLCLKGQLQLKCNANENFKVYAVSLFINSQKNICSWCEPLLYDLMASHTEGSFFAKIKKTMNENGFVTSANPEKPYISITVSAHQFYNEEKQHHCLPDKPHSITLTQDACDVLKSDAPEKYSIDIKKIAGKVILSTSERWLTKDLENMSQKEISTITKIPFYSGFRSAGAKKANRLEEVINEDKRYSELEYSVLEYDTPHCFDGNNVIALVDVSFERLHMFDKSLDA